MKKIKKKCCFFFLEIGLEPRSTATRPRPLHSSRRRMSASSSSASSSSLRDKIKSAKKRNTLVEDEAWGLMQFHRYPNKAESGKPFVTHTSLAGSVMVLNTVEDFERFSGVIAHDTLNHDGAGAWAEQMPAVSAHNRWFEFREFSYADEKTGITFRHKFKFLPPLELIARTDQIFETNIQEQLCAKYPFLKADTSALKADTSALKADTSALKADTSALKVDTSAHTTTIQKPAKPATTTTTTTSVSEKTKDESSDSDNEKVSSASEASASASGSRQSSKKTMTIPTDQNNFTRMPLVMDLDYGMIKTTDNTGRTIERSFNLVKLLQEIRLIQRVMRDCGASSLATTCVVAWTCYEWKLGVHLYFPYSSYYPEQVLYIVKQVVVQFEQTSPFSKEGPHCGIDMKIVNQTVKSKPWKEVVDAEIYKASLRMIGVAKAEECRSCKGTGKQDKKGCPTCQSKRFILQPRKYFPRLWIHSNGLNVPENSDFYYIAAMYINHRDPTLVHRMDEPSFVLDRHKHTIEFDTKQPCICAFCFEPLLVSAERRKVVPFVSSISSSASMSGKEDEKKRPLSRSISTGSSSSSSSVAGNGVLQSTLFALQQAKSTPAPTLVNKNIDVYDCCRVCLKKIASASQQQQEWVQIDNAHIKARGSLVKLISAPDWESHNLVSMFQTFVQLTSIRVNRCKELIVPTNFHTISSLNQLGKSSSLCASHENKNTQFSLSLYDPWRGLFRSILIAAVDQLTTAKEIQPLGDRYASHLLVSMDRLQTAVIHDWKKNNHPPLLSQDVEADDESGHKTVEVEHCFALQIHHLRIHPWTSLLGELFDLPVSHKKTSTFSHLLSEYEDNDEVDEKESKKESKSFEQKFKKAWSHFSLDNHPQIDDFLSKNPETLSKADKKEILARYKSIYESKNADDDGVPGGKKVTYINRPKKNRSSPPYVSITNRQMPFVYSELGQILRNLKFTDNFTDDKAKQEWKSLDISKIFTKETFIHVETTNVVFCTIKEGQHRNTKKIFFVIDTRKGTIYQRCWKCCGKIEHVEGKYVAGRGTVMGHIFDRQLTDPPQTEEEIAQRLAFFAPCLLAQELEKPKQSRLCTIFDKHIRGALDMLNTFPSLEFDKHEKTSNSAPITAAISSSSSSSSSSSAAAAAAKSTKRGKKRNPCNQTMREIFDQELATRVAPPLPPHGTGAAADVFFPPHKKARKT
jgi:hypothetical protein